MTFLAMSNSVAAVNGQIDSVVEATDSLLFLSSELRNLDSFFDVGLDTISSDILAVADNMDSINGQLGLFAVAATNLEGVSDQLRQLGPVADINLDAVSGDVLNLANSVGAINGQIDSFVGVAGGLQDISAQLRDLESFRDGANLDEISATVLTLANDVNGINGQVAEFVNILDQYIAIIDEVNTSIGGVQAGLDGQLGAVKTGIFVIMLWLLLAQITPLYLGWELVSGQREQYAGASA